MKNKKGQLSLRDVEDVFKIGLMLTFGIIFLSVLVPFVSQNLVDSFISLGIFLVTISIIIGIILVILRPRRFY